MVWLLSVCHVYHVVVVRLVPVRCFVDSVLKQLACHSGDVDLVGEEERTESVSNFLWLGVKHVREEMIQMVLCINLVMRAVLALKKIGVVSQVVYGRSGSQVLIVM